MRRVRCRVARVQPGIFYRQRAFPVQQVSVIMPSMVVYRFDPWGAADYLGCGHGARMSTWYRASRFGAEIRSIEVERDTEHFVIVKTGRPHKPEERAAKHDSCGDLFPSMAEAVKCVRARLEVKVRSQEASVEYAKACLAAFISRHGE